MTLVALTQEPEVRRVRLPHLPHAVVIQTAGKHCHYRCGAILVGRYNHEAATYESCMLYETVAPGQELPTPTVLGFDKERLLPLRHPACIAAHGGADDAE